MATDSVIVVGVDGSEGSRDALTWAVSQAELTGAAVRVVATWRWPGYLTRVPPGVDLQSDTESTVQEMVGPVRSAHSGLTITEKVVQGPAGPALLSQAEDASLLVVGARGRAAFPGLLLGSVAEYCVRNGRCPVVVVRTLPEDAVPSSPQA
jgi:nucleotide-binding universal stress UspA family protein